MRCAPSKDTPRFILKRTSLFEIAIQPEVNETMGDAIGRWLINGGREELEVLHDLDDAEIECWVKNADGSKGEEIEINFDPADRTEDGNVDALLIV